MSSKGLVTVAMITYNSAKYVIDAVNSVLNSSYQNFELVIIDDKSTDMTWSLIKSFHDERIRTYRNSSNIGEYQNREYAISLASGEYFIFIDGDDMIYPWGLNYIISQIESFPSAAMALAMQWRDYIFYPYLLSPRENFLFTYFGDSFLNNSFAQTLFKTKFLKEALPFPKDVLSGDTFIKKKISLKNQVLLVSGPISWWRKTPGQASSKLTINYASFFDSWLIDNFILSDPDCPLNEKEKLDIITNKCFVLKKIIIKELFRFNFNLIWKSLKLVPLKDILFSKKRKFSIYKANAGPETPLMIK